MLRDLDPNGTLPPELDLDQHGAHAEGSIGGDAAPRSRAPVGLASLRHRHAPPPPSSLRQLKLYLRHHSDPSLPSLDDAAFAHAHEVASGTPLHPLRPLSPLLSPPRRAAQRAPRQHQPPPPFPHFPSSTLPKLLPTWIADHQMKSVFFSSLPRPLYTLESWKWS